MSEVAIPAEDGRKRKRIMLTIPQKLDIIRRLEGGESKKNLMIEYDIASSTVYDIRAAKSKLLEFVASSDVTKTFESRRSLLKPKLAQLDKVLYEWFKLKRSEEVLISGPMIIEKARELYEEMKISERCIFSGGWLTCFKVRHDIQWMKVSGEKKLTHAKGAKRGTGHIRWLDVSDETKFKDEDSARDGIGRPDVSRKKKLAGKGSARRNIRKPDGLSCSRVRLKTSKSANIVAASAEREKKRKRIMLTIPQKLDIIRRLEGGESKQSLMKEFDIASSTVYDIKAAKSKLIEFVTSSEVSKTFESRRSLLKPKLAQLDKVLYEWFKLKRSEEVLISGPMIIEKARELYEEMKISERCIFSGGWLTCFKLRHDIQWMDVSGEKKLPKEENAKRGTGHIRWLDVSKEKKLTDEDNARYGIGLPDVSGEKDLAIEDIARHGIRRPDVSGEEIGREYQPNMNMNMNIHDIHFRNIDYSRPAQEMYYYNDFAAISGPSAISNFAYQ